MLAHGVELRKRLELRGEQEGDVLLWKGVSLSEDTDRCRRLQLVSGE